MRSACQGLRKAALAVLLMTFSGLCAAGSLLNDYHASGPTVELKDVPYLPQDGYQGGPAALAMMLGATGVQVAPADLVKQVYDAPRKHTSLLTLQTATTHYGRVPYLVYSRRMDLEVAHFVQSGHAVMVLLHTGLLFRSWQFAVVTGVDPAGNSFTVRTGEEERRQIGYDGFIDEWKDGGFWAMLVQKPGDIPAGATAQSWTAAAAPLEPAGRPDAALEAYAAVTQRWPQEVLGWKGLGNAYYALHNLNGATTAFQNALNLAPRDASVHNSLAQVLLDRECADQAEEEAIFAVRLETDPTRRAAYAHTLQQARQHSGPSVVCPLGDQ